MPSMPMTSPRPQSSRAWERADELVLSWEQQSRVDCDLQSFVESLLHDLDEWCDSSSCVHCIEIETQRLIATHGSAPAYSVLADQSSTISSDLSPTASWFRNSDASSTLYAKQPLHRDVALTLTLLFSPRQEPIGDDSDLQRLFGDVAKAAIEIISVVYLRHELAIARTHEGKHDDQSQLIAALFGGTNLRESFQAIAKAWEHHVAADRVSILQRKSNRSSLVSTASISSVDHRSRHATLLQMLCDDAALHNEEIQVLVGEPNTSQLVCQPALDAYLIESSCRRLELQLIRSSSDPQRIVALIVSEWFTGHRVASDPTFMNHVHQATRNAIDRDSSVAAQFLERFGDRTLRTKFAISIGILTAAILLLSFLPTEFSIPATGKIIPAVQRRLFAPASATVTEVAVRSGQVVREGDLLINMRSTAIELREEQLRGDLINAKTQLASLGAVRTGDRRGQGDAANALSVSANELLLKTQILGLEKQLELVALQRKELKVSSPIDGIVSRWDLDQSLAMRPVTQGQFLLDVYAPDDGWVVELEVADKDIGYLLNGPESLRRATFRLQSQPDRVLKARINEVAGSAQVTPQGRSVIRLKCSIDDEGFVPDAIGATVWADVDSGKRSVGFVWFRGLIEWWRRQAWY